MQKSNLTAARRTGLALATNLFDEQRFRLYGDSVIWRRLLAGVTATF